MLTQPRKMAHRKWHKGRRRSKGLENRGTEVSFGSFGLKSMETKWISSAQIESARKVIGRALKKKGRFWVRIFPYKPVTTKGAEVPMGGGKGAPDHFVFPVKPGRVMFEIDGISEEAAKKALEGAANKLPIKTKFVKR